MTSSQLRTIARVVFGIAILVWLVVWVNWRDVVDAMRRSDPRFVIAGMTCFICATIPAAIRLRLLFQRLQLTFGAALRLTLSSYFFNQLLPTGFGGDAYRSIRLKPASGGWVSAIGPLAFERAVGAFTLLVPALTYAVVHYGSARVVGALGALSISRRALGVGVGLLVLLLVVAVFFVKLRHQLAAVIRGLSFATICGVVACSLAFHTLRILGMSAFVAAVGYHVPPGDLVIVMALTLLASLVPLTLGALGVREGILVYTLGVCGVPAAAALTVALLNRLVFVLVGLVGAALAIGSKR
jgi:uncharacterized membrane protein YbhN (UPF0104 family)